MPITLKAFLSHRYQSPAVNAYFHEVFSDAAELQFDVDAAAGATNVTRLERMVRDTDAFVGIYPYEGERAERPTPQQLLEAKPLFPARARSRGTRPNAVHHLRRPTMPYQPKPIDTGAVVLGPPIEELVERLAESIHDNWALRRMLEGWSYGPNRDDTKKLHPDLIPYADLTESEKEYDRTTVRETVKGILALGFEIRPKNV